MIGGGRELHTSARCLTCDWHVEGGDADRAAHLHTTSSAKGHERHSTSSSTHILTLCSTVHPVRGRVS